LEIGTWDSGWTEETLGSGWTEEQSRDATRSGAIGPCIFVAFYGDDLASVVEPDRHTAQEHQNSSYRRNR
jgi:hypothetical protein